ncbi:MAG: hypothetical protein KF791_20805 [Verrucomicrobiae bacterium]|nr:hypothetical protein [Verrucomicrobiae bacterium]
MPRASSRSPPDWTPDLLQPPASGLQSLASVPSGNDPPLLHDGELLIETSQIPDYENALTDGSPYHPMNSALPATT